jgi:hypothetical protein
METKTVWKVARKKRKRIFDDKFDDKTTEYGVKIVGAMKQFDIARIGFIAAANLAMKSLEMGAYQQLPEGSKLKSFLARSHRLYDESVQNQAVPSPSGEQGTPPSLSPASLRQAEAEWYHTHTTDLDAITRIGEPDEREACMSTFYSLQ